MTGRPDLASRLVVGLVGPELAEAEESWIARYRPAGVILFRRNVRDADQLAALCGRLHDVLPTQAEIMADHEGGPVSVLDVACGRPPAPWTLGVLDDPDLTRAVMRDAARSAHDAGVDRMLAPCMDILAAPDNPIIGARAFGNEPDRVARHVAAAVEGIVSTGMRCCLKHWPGHGGTRGDTHLEAVAPVTPDDPAPLRAGLSAGADAVMLGHLCLSGDARPASISPEAVAMLRAVAPSAQLFTDDLTMGALRDVLGHGTDVSLPRGGLCDPAVLPRSWFEAAAHGGCDTLLCRGIPWKAWPQTEADRDTPRLGPDTDPLIPPDVQRPASPPSWTEFLDRTARPCLSTSCGDLLYWRPSSDHRWGTLSEEHLRTAGWRGGLRLMENLETGESEIRYGQLLVASHAPLTDEDVSDLAPLLEPAGLCVALGHPSLATTLTARLPTAWKLVAGHDLTVPVLTGFIEVSGHK